MKKIIFPNAINKKPVKTHLNFQSAVDLGLFRQEQKGINIFQIYKSGQIFPFAASESINPIEFARSLQAKV